MKIRVFLILFFLFFSFNLYSETVYLKNGDKITGSVIREENNTLVLGTLYMGEVSLDRESIQSIENSDESVISEPDPQPQSQPKPDLWEGEFSLGYNRTSGNTENSQLSSELQLKRKTDIDEFTARLRGFYSSTDKKMNSQKWYGSVRYAYSFWDKRWYNFYKLEASHDRFSNIDYRITPSAGVGYWYSDTKDFKLMTEIGLGWEYTEYRDNTNSQTQLILLPRLFLEKALTDTLRFSQDLTLYPSLEDTGEFRLYSETSLINAVTENISLKLSLIDDYNSDPASGIEKNDTQFISSLIYSF